MGSCSDPSLTAARTSANSPADGMPEAAPRTLKMSKMGLHQIVRLRQMVQQWRRRAANNIDRTLQVMSVPSGAARKLLLRRSTSSSGQFSSSESSRSSSSMSESDQQDDQLQLPPEGFLALYVGQERRRFLIRTEDINHPLLRGLLQRTADEFGLNQKGALSIPACEVVLFEHMLWMVENQDVHALDDPVELQEILDFYMHVSSVGTNATTSCMQEANLREVPCNNKASTYGRLHH